MLRICLIITLIIVTHTGVRAQNKYSLSFKNEPLINALEKVTKKYDIRFAYNYALLKEKKITVEISCDAEEKLVEKLFENTGIRFRKVNDLYLLEPKNITNERCVLSGFVKDAVTGEALPYTVVRVKNQNAASLTNESGHYAINATNADTLIVTFHYLGYKTEKMALLWSETGKKLEIRLKPKSELLNEIIVKDTYKNMVDLVDNSNTLNNSKLKLLPKAGEPDIFYGLKFIPGVCATEEKSSGIIVRGQPAEYNLVLYDGFPVYHLDHFFGAFSAINIEAVKKIQFYKSTYPARLGGRANGIIEILGRTGNYNKPSFNIGMNMLSSNILIETPVYKKFSLLIAARRSFTDIIQSSVYRDLSNALLSNESETTYSFGGHIENISNEVTPSYYYDDINVKCSWKPSNKNTITASFYKGEDNYQTDDNYTSSFNTIQSTSKVKWGNIGAGIKWKRQWNAIFHSEMNATISRFNSDYYEHSTNSFFNLGWVDSVKINDINKIEDISLYWNNQLKYKQKHTLKFGLYYSGKSTIYNRYRELNLVESTDGYSGEYAFYLQNTFNLYKNLSANLGFRCNYYDKTNRLYPEPRLSIKYTISPSIVCRAGASVHHQFINKVIFLDNSWGVKDVWALANDAKIPVVSAQQYTIGANWQLGSFNFDLELYSLDFNGVTAYQIPASHLSYSPSVYYQGESNSKGVELFVQKTGKLMNTSISYSLSYADQKFDKINQGFAFPTNYDQRHELNLVQNLKLKKWEFVATWMLGSGKPYSKPLGVYTIDLLGGNSKLEINESVKNSFRLPIYQRLDFSINYFFQLNRVKFNTGISIINLFNSKNTRIQNRVVRNPDEFDESEYVIKSTSFMGLGFTPNFHVRISI